MTEERAIRFLEVHLGHDEKHARHIIGRVNVYIASQLKRREEILGAASGRSVCVDKTIGSYPESWFLSLLLDAGEIGRERFQYLLRHDLRLPETPEERDAMLTQAFCGTGPNVADSPS